MLSFGPGGRAAGLESCRCPGTVTPSAGGPADSEPECYCVGPELAGLSQSASLSAFGPGGRAAASLRPGPASDTEATWALGVQLAAVPALCSMASKPAVVLRPSLLPGPGPGVRVAGNRAGRPAGAGAFQVAAAVTTIELVTALSD